MPKLSIEMNPLRLLVPDRRFEVDNSGYPNPEEVPAWLDVLPMGSPEKAAEQLVILLRHYNTVVLDSRERLNLLNHLVLSINDTSKALQARYRDSAYPLSERNYSRYNLVDQLFTELAVGYKCIVVDMHAKSMSLVNGELFISAVDKAIHFLSKQLLAAYSIYIHEPAGIWGDLNQLYRCAEEFSRHPVVVEKERLQHLLTIAKRAYRRIVLLSVANPYHLMQGEALLIFNYLNKWAANTSIASLNGYVASIGDLVIDLASDSAPQFIYDMELDEPEMARTVVMTQLMEQFNATIEKFTRRALSNDESNISFNERMRRDMLMRLKRVWIERLQRKSIRKATESRVRLAEGMSACHYFIDDEQEFFPERDEIKYHKPDGLREGMSLVPDNYEPWKQQKIEDQLLSNVANTRMSNFDDQAMDVWHKIYANKSSGSKDRMTAIKHFETYYWHLANHSIDGVGLRRFKLSNARVHVGSLVAFHDDKHKDIYFIGVIRWIKQNNNDTFDMGIKVIPGTPKAVATRGVKGAGGTSEYFRSIVMETQFKDHKKTTVILPAGIYDSGSVLVLNMRDHIEYILLNKMLRTTTTITHFSYETIDLPKEEKAKIRELQKKF